MAIVFSKVLTKFLYANLYIYWEGTESKPSLGVSASIYVTGLVT